MFWPQLCKIASLSLFQRWDNGGLDQSISLPSVLQEGALRASFEPPSTPLHPPCLPREGSAAFRRRELLSRPLSLPCPPSVARFARPSLPPDGALVHQVLTSAFLHTEKSGWRMTHAQRQWKDSTDGPSCSWVWRSSPALPSLSSLSPFWFHALCWEHSEPQVSELNLFKLRTCESQDMRLFDGQFSSSCLFWSMFFDVSLFKNISK